MKLRPVVQQPLGLLLLLAKVKPEVKPEMKPEPVNKPQNPASSMGLTLSTSRHTEKMCRT